MSAVAPRPSSPAPTPGQRHGIRPPQPPMGLRERKKLKTRIAIRRATYRLIAEQGYGATTVEQIAEAAEVSPSTVFRYFPTKEDIVLTAEHDPLRAAAPNGPPDEDPFDAVRRVVGAALVSFVEECREEAVQRTRLMAEIPAVRARMPETLAGAADLVTATLADRSGRPRDDLSVRIHTAAILGVLREVVLHWAEGGHREDPVELMDRALLTLRDGLSPAPARAAI